MLSNEETRDLVSFGKVDVQIDQYRTGKWELYLKFPTGGVFSMPIDDAIATTLCKMVNMHPAEPMTPVIEGTPLSAENIKALTDAVVKEMARRSRLHNKPGFIAKGDY